MKRVALLIRVSTKYQDYTAQTNELIQFVKQDGYTDDEMEVIKDKESATKLPDEERQGLNKLYEAINKPENSIEAVYCWELSRLSRKPISLYKIRSLLEGKKIDLRTKHESFRLLNKDKIIDPISNILWGFYVSMCENEMLQKVERTRRIKEQNALNGIYTGGSIKYGYYVDADTKKYKIKEDEAIIIRLVFDLYNTGIGANKVYRELKNRGYDITIYRIQRILRSPEYIGGIRPAYTEKQNRKKGTRIVHHSDRYYPPIITAKQYEKSRIVAKYNNTNVDKSKNIYYAHKLIKCSSCDTYLIAYKNSVQYNCISKYSLLRPKECASTDRININVIDSILWHITKRKEAEFIINQSQELIEKYENIINELNQKLLAIDKRYKEVEQDKEDLLERSYRLKMKNKKFEELLQEIEQSERQIAIDKNEWEEEIRRLTKLIDDINKKTIHNKETKDKFEKLLSITEKSAAILIMKKEFDNINDDNIIYDLIHKHIKGVRINTVDDIFKQVKKVKQIIITPFLGKDIIYYYYYNQKTKLSEKNIYQIQETKVISGDESEEDILKGNYVAEKAEYSKIQMGKEFKFKVRFERR
ncbi:MAG: recombinase family protein [Dysgonomonas sp.]